MMKRRSVFLIGFVCVIGLLVILGYALSLHCWIPWMLGKTNVDFSLPIENGYFVVRANAATCCIWKRGKEPVPPNIVGIAIHGPIAIGRTVKSPTVDSIEGYFILEMKTGRSYCGLKWREWKDLLKDKYDITYLVLRLPSDMYQEWKKSVGAHEVHREIKTRQILEHTDILIFLAKQSTNEQRVPTELPDLVDWLAKDSSSLQDGLGVDVKGRTIRDAWGNPIVLVIEEGTLVALGSMGRNEKWDGSSVDDIVVRIGD